MMKRIDLVKFRSYNKQTFQFDASLTYIVGPNTAGKTNILEAISVIATGKSFRGVKDQEMIAFGESLARINAQIDDAVYEMVITTGMVDVQRTPRKRYSVNGVPRRIGDAFSRFPVVIFCPEDLDIVRGSPSLRRKFLDFVLMQSDREYRRNLVIYEKALRQRNKLLFLIHEGVSSRDQLDYWNTLLINSGTVIHQQRKNFLAFQNTLSIDGKIFSAAYDHSIINAERLEQYKDEEVSAKATLVGPHRDDIQLLISQHTVPDSDARTSFVNLAAFGSRGEQRLGVLWLKLGSLLYLKQATGIHPLLLLDDIFSELDQAHQRLVLSLLDSHQTIITSADVESVSQIQHMYPGTIINL